MSRDLPASIKARLLNEARRRGVEFEPFLVRYVCERFLFRLGRSDARERCTLKGAGLLTLWMDEPYRATRDVDLLAAGASDGAAVRTTMEAICSEACPEDGLEFDLASLSVTPIRDDQRYTGQRAVLRTHLGKSRIRLQVDFGFGDALSALPEEADFPTLLPGLPSPTVRAYPRVATVAEKFEAMIQLGRRNSRMKDFHDIWALCQAFAFEGASLQEAVSRCFERRGTAWTPEVPSALMPAFYSDPEIETRWHAYRRKSHFGTSPPEAFPEVGDCVRAFLGPVRESIIARAELDRHWPPGGPWMSSESQRGGGHDV